MSYKPYTFFKNYEQRLLDFNRLLSPISIKACEVKKIWTNCVELTVEPIGWQAIWKISRNLCNDLKIYYPCSVIVYIESVNFEDLSCLVKIQEVEDEEIHLPEKMADVPLIELYPIEEQDCSSALSLFDTAEMIDNLRFFYKHIWMPWDLESEYDDESYWVEKHLQLRLQLHYSLVERKLPAWVGLEVRTMVKEGRKVLEDIEDLEAALEDNTESSPRLLQLTELHHTLTTLRNGYTLYERPELLKAILEKEEQTEKKQELDQGNAETTIHCVLSTMTAERLTALASRITNDRKLRCFTSAQEALVREPKGEVWLTQGEHTFHDLALLETGGSITGVEESVVLIDDSEGSSGLDLYEGSIALSNLTVKLTSRSNIVTLRPGSKCSLSEVKMQGSAAVDGFRLFPSATLSAVNCVFSDYSTAIFCDSQASLHLVNCTFTNNKIALQLNDGCLLTMENCTIAGSKFYGMQLIVQRPIAESKPSLGFINSVDNMRESGTICEQNTVDLHFLRDICNR